MEDFARLAREIRDAAERAECLGLSDTVRVLREAQLAAEYAALRGSARRPN